MEKLIPVILLLLPFVQLNAQELSFYKTNEEMLFEEGKYFAQCHASTMEEAPNGNILASWFAGSHEGNKDVAIWGSIYDGQSWSAPQIWANGIIDGEQFPCWNPVLFRAKNENKIYLYYKVGPNPREWWGMVKTSTDNGKTWSEATALPQGILGAIKNRPVELNNGIILSPSSIELSEERWVAHIEKSTDKQKTWKPFPIDYESDYNVIQPSILLHDNGKIQVLCRSKEGKVISSFSEDQGETWSSLTPTNLINPNSATDAIPYKGDLLIVYNPDIPGKDWWEGRTKLRLATSKNGLEWNDILVLEDEDKGEFSYPTIFQDSKGNVHITYTHNRKNIKHIVLNEN